MDEGWLRHDGNDQKSEADFSIAKAIYFRYCDRHIDLSDRYRTFASRPGGHRDND